jgi:hypothetical protein
MRKTRTTIVALLSAMAIGLAACGADSSTPTGGMTASYEAAKSGSFVQQSNFIACVVAGGFGSGNALLDMVSGLAPEGDTNELSDAFTMSFDEFTVSEVSRSEDQATVNVSFTATVDADMGKVRDLLGRYAEGRGVTVDDATLDAELDRQFGQFPVTQVVTHDVSVVQADGKWSACAESTAAMRSGSWF